MKGQVRYYNAAKGQGFIHGEDGTDYPVLWTGIPAGMELDHGTEVDFDLERNENLGCDVAVIRPQA